jgi:23S rRNA G2069 N7-methylase RlmK/C1962 C5-methylase RlmI
VILTDGTGEKALGWGVFNPNSTYRVRLLVGADEEAFQNPNLESLIDQRIAHAVQLRRLLGLPHTTTSATTVYRLINSEGDRLSGLIVDVLGDLVVVSSCAAWVEQHKETIQDALRKHIAAGKTVIWRPAVEMLRQEGLEDESSGVEGDDSATNEADSAAAAAATDNSDDFVEVMELGVAYKASPYGQKTGFYADQRDNRQVIASLCKEKTVLDLCCYSGGFALNAAMHGASHVVGVDSSAPAIELAKANAALNGLPLSGGSVEFVKAEVSSYMKEQIQQGKANNWDIVILDPPKLAPTKASLRKAVRKYTSLNAAAMKLVKPGGLLMTCSCSGAMAAAGDEQFDAMLRAAAISAGRKVTVLRRAGAGGDHPVDVHYPEGKYLTNVLVRVL